MVFLLEMQNYCTSWDKEGHGEFIRTRMVDRDCKKWAPTKGSVLTFADQESPQAEVWRRAGRTREEARGPEVLRKAMRGMNPGKDGSIFPVGKGCR